MTDRPYIRAGLQELERLFHQGHDDRSVLAALLAELAQRSTDGAAKLRRQVASALDALDEAHAGPTTAGAGADTGPSAPEHAERPTADRTGPQPSRPRKPIENRPEDILSAWTALEVLSPSQPYRKPADMVSGETRRIVEFSKAPRPVWLGDSEKSRPGKRLFYHVVLGAIRTEESTRELFAVFLDNNADRQPARGFSAIATITTDKRGVPIEESCVSISSFAWALPLALKGDLEALGRWAAVQTRLVEELEEFVRAPGLNGEVPPLSYRMIEAAFDRLVARLNLPERLILRPTFAIRTYHSIYAKEPPDSPMLGSFFLNDLAAARELAESGKLPQNLALYLGATPAPKRQDVIADERLVAAAVAPRRIPIGRWPAPGRHPLVLLQQAAVNLAVAPDRGTLLPVNGPPGTGKTTLLRDVVAALVVERAMAMCGFDDPATAFKHVTSHSVGKVDVSISRIDPSLRGFEMLVASTNNAAVENVSRELPGLGAIASDARLAYFRTVSDHVANGRDTWGLIAAVLGNSSNRYEFSQRAWSDEDHGLKAYLSEAAGMRQTISEPDPHDPGREITRRPVVVDAEHPPADRREALRRWAEIRAEFQKAVAAVRDDIAGLESARKAAGELPFLRDLTSAAKDHLDHHAERPRFLSRMFKTQAARTWSAERARRADRLEKAHREHARVAGATSEMGLNARSADPALVHANAAAAHKRAAETVGTMRARFKSRVVDARFFARERHAVHTESPWLDDEAQAARDRVFELAMNLHKAFIDAAASPLRSNLEILFRTFYGKLAWSAKMAPVMPDLWASLFLVVPVVSTTFASVERMLGFLPHESLGWLLVDEAGQASPQAVVGAMMRTKRAIVVGDPQQIEPVTSLPTSLADEICHEFGVEPSRWSAPTASVQSVADATAALGAEFARQVGSVRVGFPLLVHRRCAEPMFSVSNELAYSGLMVQATARRSSAVRDVLGPSRWIDVRPGRTEEKWSESEGDVVIELLTRLAEESVGPPIDLYIVSPFVIVASRLRERVLQSELLSKWTDDPWEWVRRRIGTVHTVQGREADSVILVLGAALPAQAGARAWAGGSVNLLNVAATRAKENLYVVGSRSAWQNVGSFQKLAAKLPVGDVTSNLHSKTEAARQ